jgi:hypothetical protein
MPGTTGHAAVPTFVTVRVKVTVPPLGTGLGVTVFLISRSHTPPVTVMVTQDWLLAGLVSFGLLTVAQFWMLLPGGAVTVPVKVNVAE